MPCNAICLPTYQSGGIQKIKPENGAVYAPFVTMNLGSRITVGNSSFPTSGNNAAIVSMDYGASDGSGITIEIVDQDGVSFSKIFDELNKDICDSPEDYKMSVDFGWLSTDCNGNVSRMGIPDGPITFLPLDIDSSYEGGIIKYTLKGQDMFSHMGENRADAPIGTEAQKVRLKNGIRQILSRNCPSVNNVRFMRRRGDSLSEWNFKNSDGGPDGPMSVWPADQQNVISAIRKWSSSVTTDRNKGFYPVWNSGSAQPEIWLFEDSRNYCDETIDGSDSIGTFLVNGGDCSPVISFNPTAKWIHSDNFKSGGGGGGPTGARVVKNRQLRSRACETKDDGGITTQFPPAQNDINWRPPDLVAVRQQQAIEAQSNAARNIELSAPLEGELKIHGNPLYVHQAQWIQKYMSIIVINPFNIYSGGSYCEWLAAPMCNPVFSDKRWRIGGVNHQIQEGSYTTTFKVKCENVTKTEE